MEPLTVYEKPTCSTCRRLFELLISQGVDFERVNYHVEPLPGVGISIGVSRILGRLFGQGLLAAERKTPTVVLVAHVGAGPDAVVRALRSRGIPAEAYHEEAKLGKQMKYANDKGIPYVRLPFDEGDQVRDMASGDQAAAEVESWNPA